MWKSGKFIVAFSLPKPKNVMQACGKMAALDIVGLEVIRGDWAAVAKKVQEHVLEIILKEPSPKKAVEFVRSMVLTLRQRKVPLQDLIIWKTLTKSPEDYAIKAPHVEAAKHTQRQRVAINERRQSRLRHFIRKRPPLQSR